MTRIPPHIGWPLAIVGLLSLSVVASLLTVFAARSDGGAQVIDDYYHKAATWDSTHALQASSEALGWQIHITTESTEGTARFIRLQVTSQDAQPVTGLHGTLAAFRPHLAQIIDETELIETAPGIYQQAINMAQPGLWDFEIRAIHDNTPFSKRIRLEVLP